MDSISFQGSQWRKSSFSAIGDCVAVCRLSNGSIGVRNTNDPDAQILELSPEDMAEWLARIKTGAFDNLCEG